MNRVTLSPMRIGCHRDATGAHGSATLRPWRSKHFSKCVVELSSQEASCCAASAVMVDPSAGEVDLFFCFRRRQ